MIIITFPSKAQLFLLLLLASVVSFQTFAANSPCSGPYGLLNIVNRPTIADSPCTVPDKKMIAEQGYQFVKLLDEGYAQNYPSSQLRIGLPKDNEFFVWLPNYILRTIKPDSGFTETWIGLKHQVKSTKNWIFTIEGTSILPSGSINFGSKGTGGFLNGIFYYLLNDKLSITTQLGISSQTESIADGGQRFSSINPDMFINWSLSNKVQLYAEIYGQSKTAPNQGSGFNIAAGIEYLLTQNMLVDLEGGQRLSGALGGLERYIGAGMSIQFK